MKLLDRIWNMMGLVEAEDSEVPEQVATGKLPGRSERQSESLVRPGGENVHRSNQQQNNRPPVVSASNDLAPNPVTQENQLPDSANNRCKFVLAQTVGFDDARHIAENVTNGKTVLVNFEQSDGETTKRTVDFMSGITYAVGGTVQRISSSIFLFAPAHVDIFASVRPEEEEQKIMPWRRS